MTINPLRMRTQRLPKENSIYHRKKLNLRYCFCFPRCMCLFQVYFKTYFKFISRLIFLETWLDDYLKRNVIHNYILYGRLVGNVEIWEYSCVDHKWRYCSESCVWSILFSISSLILLEKRNHFISMPTDSTDLSWCSEFPIQLLYLH